MTKIIVTEKNLTKIPVSPDYIVSQLCYMCGASPQEVPLSAFSQLGGRGCTSPLYVFQSGAYLIRAKVTSTLRTLLECLSIPAELYASHSFRIGAATTAAKAGLSPWLIQTLGRWPSNCFSLYIRTPSSILQKVPEMLATSHPSGQGGWTSLPGPNSTINFP